MKVRTFFVTIGLLAIAFGSAHAQSQPTAKEVFAPLHQTIAASSTLTFIHLSVVEKEHTSGDAGKQLVCGPGAF